MAKWCCRHPDVRKYGGLHQPCANTGSLYRLYLEERCFRNVSRKETIQSDYLNLNTAISKVHRFLTTHHRLGRPTTGLAAPDRGQIQKNRKSKNPVSFYEKC